MAITKVSASLVDLDGGVVINESSADADFRVESNDKTHMLFVDSGNNKVGINSSSPQTTFVVQHTDGGIGIEFSMGDPVSFIQCYNRTSNDYASLSIDAEDIRFRTNDGSERMRIASTGNVSIGTTTVDRELKVQKSGDSAVIAAVSGTSNLAGMVMGDTSDDDRGAVLYNNSGDYLYFQANAVQYGQFNSTGEFHVTSGGNAIAPTIKHGGATGDVAKIRVINRSGQGADKGGVLELGAITDDGVSRSDVFASIAGLKDNATSGNKAGYMQFMTSNGSSLAEKMRLDSNGKLFLGTTSGVRGAEDFSIDASSDAIVARTAGAGLIVRKTSFSNGFLCLFENDSATAVGSITSGGSSTVYNTSSDYRLKENIETMQNGLERLNKLNPVKFTWKETGEEAEGFIAHEVDEIFSDCVYGEKDGDEMQGVDYGRITPLLVKAVQELTAEVEELKTKLESK